MWGHFHSDQKKFEGKTPESLRTQCHGKKEEQVGEKKNASDARGKRQ